MSDPLDNTAPLGKSVEQVEDESQNVVNSRVDGEDRRVHDDLVPAVIPVANQGGGSAGVYGVVADRDALVDNRGEGATDGRNDKDLDETPQ